MSQTMNFAGICSTTVSQTKIRKMPFQRKSIASFYVFWCLSWSASVTLFVCCLARLSKPTGAGAFFGAFGARFRRVHALHTRKNLELRTELRQKKNPNPTSDCKAPVELLRSSWKTRNLPWWWRTLGLRVDSLRRIRVVSTQKSKSLAQSAPFGSL